MFVPTREAVLHMSPTDFEMYALSVLQEQCNGLDSVTFQHNRMIKTDDGNYQIDGYVEFEIMGLRFKSIVECKHYRTSIPREKVQVLFDKVRATGAHKGILISSSSFQAGAIEYASKHGIALIQLIDAGAHVHTRQQHPYRVIMNKPRVPWNSGCPYIGVMQYKKNGGIVCSYLSRTNLFLRDFLTEQSGMG
ncbi:MAG: restriction endonuclease [Bacillota bacterium]